MSLERLYETRPSDSDPFGSRYSPPSRMTFGAWATVARYEKTGGDGQPVEIDECRLPARFYRLRALASTNSVGHPIAAFALSTGTGMGKLVAALAEAIAEGAIGITRTEGSEG